MTLIPGESYEIVYVAHGEERQAHAHYRGQGSADTIARGEESVDHTRKRSNLTGSVSTAKPATWWSNRTI